MKCHTAQVKCKMFDWTQSHRFLSSDSSTFLFFLALGKENIVFGQSLFVDISLDRDIGPLSGKNGLLKLACLSVRKQDVSRKEYPK